MMRMLLPALVSFVLCGTGMADEPIKVQFGQAPTKADSNREIIDLLKQVIQKLEARDKTPATSSGAVRLWDVTTGKELAGTKAVSPIHVDVVPGTAISRFWQEEASGPDLTKAGQEVELARKRLDEATDKLRRLEAARPQAKTSGWKAVEVKPDETKPADAAQRRIQVIRGKIEEKAKEKTVPESKRQELEKRLERLMRELEELRRELKK
jgi:hypothetical protein